MPSVRPIFLQHFPGYSAKIRLWWLLVVPFVLQTVGTVALVGYLSYRSGQEAVENLAHQLMKNVGQQVTQELDRYLQKAHNFNQRQITAIESGAINLQNLDRLHRYLILQHRQNQELTTLLLGTPQGDFRVSHRVSKRDYGVTTHLKPGELPFEVAISKASNPAINYTYSVNQAGDLGHYLETIKNIDVRDRPWYRQAVKTGKAGWTSPFQISSTNILALNAYTPFYDKSRQLLGVFAVNISLNQLSDFLRRLEVGQSGEVFIIERNGLLIANSTKEASYSVSGKPDLSGISEPGTLKFKRRLPSQISNSLIQDSYQYLKAKFSNLATIKSPQALNFQIRGKSYFLTVSPYQDKYGLDWLIVTVIPESDFMAQIQSNTRTTVLLCLLTLAMAIASGLTIANQFTTRISRLKQVSQQLAAGDLTQRLPADSSIVELQELGQFFNQMADRLEASFDRLHNALEKSEGKFTTIFRASPDAICITDADGRFLEVNNRMLELYGYSREEMIGRSALELGLWINLKEREQFIDLLTTQGWVYNIEVLSQTKTGEIKTLLLAAEACDLQGQNAVIVIIRDISDRAKLETALRQSEAKFQELAAASPAIIFSLTVDAQRKFQYEYLNPVAEVIHEVPLAELLRDGSWALNQTHPDDRAQFQKAVAYSIKTLQPFENERRIITPSGKIRWLSVNARCQRRETGQVVWHGIAIDITDHKQAEIALLQSELKFVTIFLDSPQPAWIATLAEGRCIDVNDSFTKVLGYSRIQAIGKTCVEMQLWTDLADFHHFHASLLQYGRINNFEVEFRTKSGEIKTVLLFAKVTRLDEQNCVIGVLNDISDRKQAEIALQTSETRLRLALKASGAIAWERDLKTDEMVFSNTVTSHIPDKISYQQAMALVHPDDREVLDRANQEAIAQKGTFQIEHRIATSLQNPEWRWFQVSAKVLTDSTGKPTRIIGMSVDITDRHQLDAMKNEFVSIVSHELRTPLTSIHGSLNLLKSGVLKNKPDKAQQMLEIAVNNTDRLVRLVNDILDLQRLDSGKMPLVKEICQVSDLIEQAIESVRAIADQANVTLESASLSASVFASSDEIIQTLINLLGNAIKFSPSGSVIWVKAEVINHSDRRILAKFPDLENPIPASYILFSIVDQGRGIPTDKLELIFGRFQQVDASDSRTKGGTGLGLAICKNIVQRHQGLIWAESILGQGSTFYFTLPVGQV
ncbi:PAS domain S-box protein [Floridanema evergladense]|uniref:histidine kinase n=1 Tax=Floridaenema evergladense BLCC-F167 TaxID=3153639 RepID=A0ABV4WG67_9CYAN